MKEELWYITFIKALVPLQISFILWGLWNYFIDMEVISYFSSIALGDYDAEYMENRWQKIISFEWKYWTDWIRANIYLVLWIFIWYFCFFRDVSRQHYKFLSKLMIFFFFPLAIIDFLLIQYWHLTSLAIFYMVLFVIISPLSGIYNFVSVWLHSTNYKFMKVFFSPENNRMVYEFLVISFLIAILGELGIKFLWDSSSNYILYILFDKRGILVLFIGLFLLKLGWNYRHRFMAWKKALSIFKSNPSQSVLPVYVVVDSIGPITRSTIFDLVTEREQLIYDHGLSAPRNIIAEIEKLTFNHQNARCVVLSPDLWDALQDRVKYYHHLLIHVQVSSDFLVSLCNTSLLKEHIVCLKNLFLRPNTLILSNHQLDTSKTIHPVRTEEDEWISTIKEVSLYSEHINQENDQFLHYLPEKVHTTVEEFLSVQSIWQHLEKTAGYSLSELNTVLPDILGQYLEKVKRERNPVEVFYGLSKTLEMLVHFYALVAVAFHIDTPSKRADSSFKTESEGASLGRWFEIGKKYSELFDPHDQLSEWWDGYLSPDIQASIQELLAGVGAKLNRLSAMRDLHEFVVTFRNKTSGHGVLTYEAASEALQNLAVVTGKALSCAAQTKVSLVKSSKKLFIKLENLEIDVSDLFYEENGRYYVLSAHHCGSPEFICYQTGDIVMAEGLQIRLDE